MLRKKGSGTICGHESARILILLPIRTSFFISTPAFSMQTYESFSKCTDPIFSVCRAVVHNELRALRNSSRHGWQGYHPFDSSASGGFGRDWARYGACLCARFGAGLRPGRREMEIFYWRPGHGLRGPRAFCVPVSSHEMRARRVRVEAPSMRAPTPIGSRRVIAKTEDRWPPAAGRMTN